MKKLVPVLLIMLFSVVPVFSGSVDKMNKDELKSLLGSETLVILDVRTGRDWSTSEFKIKDAIRVEGKDLSAASNFTKDHTFVLYCA